MAVLTGKAAIDYIMAGNNDWQSLTPGLENTNQMPAFRSFIEAHKGGFNTPQTFLDAQPGTLGGFLNNMAQGVGGIINRPAEILSALQPGQKTSTGLLNASQSGAYKPYWTTAKEKADIENILQNPAGESIKAGAGIASLLIPGGGTLGGMVARGALSGGLYGLSQNKEGQNLLGDVVKSALLGGGAAGGLSLLGKGASALLKKIMGKVGEGTSGASVIGEGGTPTNAVEGEVVNEIPKQTQAQPKIQDILSGKPSASNFGEVPGVGQQAPSPTVANKLLTTEIVNRAGIKSEYLKDMVKDKLGDILTEGNKLVPDGNLLTSGGQRKILEVLYPEVKNRLIDAGSHVPLSNQIKNSIIDNIFTELPRADMFYNNTFWEAYLKLTGVRNYADLINFETWLNTARQGFAGTTTGATAMSKRILDTFGEAIGNNIKNMNPALKEGYSILSTMQYGMAGIDKILKESTRARFYEPPFGIAFNFQPLVTGARGVASQVVNKASNFNLPNMTNTLPGILNSLGTSVPTLPGAIGALSQMQNEKNQSNLTTPLSTQNMPNILQPQPKGNADLQNYLNSISQGTAGATAPGGTQTTQFGNPNAQIILGLLNSKMKPSDVKIVAELLGLTGGGGKQLTTAAAEKITDTQTSLDYLDQLEQAVGTNSSRFGLLQGGALGNIVQGLGLDPGRAYIQSQINTIAQVIGKALEGGKLTDQDIERYRQMLPTLTDTPDNAMQKIASLRALLKSRLSSQVTGYENAGYSAQDMLDALNSAGAQ